MNNDPILEVRNLKTHFFTYAGVVKAVDGVSFQLRRGETLTFVGESGSGKTITNLSIIRLIPSPPGKIVGGEVRFMGEDVFAKSEKEMCQLRGHRISMIFQDPMTCLNPLLRVSSQMRETINLHQGLGKKEAKGKSVEMLQKVGIPDPEKWMEAFPYQLSGGMRQRIMIAMALSCNPEVLIADEPTSALDVTIQAQILEIIQELSVKMNTAVILITHDLGVVARMSDQVCVMYAGRMVEVAPVLALFENPQHPYTQGLMKSVPRLDIADRERLYSIRGSPPHLIGMPECCPFYPRCARAADICRQEYPPETDLGNGHRVNCWHYGEEER
jgi:oligopeptide transport system ATP-binding protein